MEGGDIRGCRLSEGDSRGCRLSEKGTLTLMCAIGRKATSFWSNGAIYFTTWP